MTRGRKKGGKNHDTDAKAQVVAEKVILEGKTQAQASRELGITKNTASKLMKHGLAQPEIQERIQRSKNRLIRMLGLSDQAYVRVLRYNHPDNFGNQIKVATSIYKTLGVVKEDPIVNVNVFQPIKVSVENREYTIGLDQNPTAPQTGPSV